MQFTLAGFSALCGFATGPLGPSLAMRLGSERAAQGLVLFTLAGFSALCGFATGPLGPSLAMRLGSERAAQGLVLFTLAGFSALCGFATGPLGPSLAMRLGSERAAQGLVQFTLAGFSALCGFATGRLVQLLRWSVPVAEALVRENQRSRAWLRQRATVDETTGPEPSAGRMGTTLVVGWSAG